MAGLTYVLDTNVISDALRQNERVRSQLRRSVVEENTVCLCQPVYYELLRGLLKANAVTKLSVLQDEIRPLVTWIPLTDADWEQAARFWAEATGKGRQFSDVDLLIAAVAARLNGILVSADDDFDALPITREDWRKPSAERQ